ncbi:acetyl-CoA carboxylase biotin carboxylase subunit family protein [Nocardiopsis alba]|jgi:hypothetical protein|uniref:ATP-grasp domain-containing protein n=1 Tax=Nocardiopsis alba TaxID=53437 RepID=UPI0033A28320
MTRPPIAIRSLDLAQASPFLEHAWDKILADHPEAELWIGDQPPLARIPARARESGHLLGEVPTTHDGELVVSWSIPNERTLEESTLFENGNMVPGPLPAVYALADKRAAKSLFQRFGLPTPRGTVLDRGFSEGGLLQPSFRRRLEQQLVAPLRYPLIMKPLWDCMGHGVRIVDDPARIEEAIGSSTARDLLVEEFLDGHAGSIEVLGEPGDYQFQSPCWTGSSFSGVSQGFDSLRVSHPDLFSDVLTKEFRTSLTDLLSSLGYRGACCVDFVVDGERIFVLEINPRVSGASCLSAAASGVDAFEASYRIAASQWHRRPRRVPRGGASIQAGGEWAARLVHRIHEDGLALDWYRDREIVVDGAASRSVIVGGAPDIVRSIFERLDVNGPFSS